MKRVLFLLLFFIISFYCFSQTSTSYSVSLGKGITGSLWHPRVAFSKVNDDTELIWIILTNTEKYEMDYNSTLLVKLNNDSILQFKRIGDLKTEYDNKIIGSTVIGFYHTYASYECIDKEINLIRENGISKIRVELTNGDRYDWEVPIKRKDKLIKEINKAYEIMIYLYDKREKNLNSNLKDNF